ncbi:MAG: hypothetical protein OEY94_07255 [Alphaproteobacteria bacterium]|nr:hypothetical protein [Alphaproteobacteria bacterium]
MLLPLVRYVLQAALRDRLVLALFLVLAVATALSIFFGSSAVIEKDIFSVVFIAGSLRIASILGLTLFVIFFVRKSFDSKDIEFLLSRPIGRVRFILSYSTAFNIIAVLLGLAGIATIYAMSLGLEKEGHFIWALSYLVECIIMVNVAFFFALYISSAANAAMATAAFYILGRMMGQILGIIDSNLLKTSLPVEMAMTLVSILVPRLDLMAQNSWLVYGLQNPLSSVFFVIAQCLVFYFLIINAILLDFVRRQF